MLFPHTPDHVRAADPTGLAASLFGIALTAHLTYALGVNTFTTEYRACGDIILKEVVRTPLPEIF